MKEGIIISRKTFHNNEKDKAMKDSLKRSLEEDVCDTLHTEADKLNYGEVRTLCRDCFLDERTRRWHSDVYLVCEVDTEDKGFISVSHVRQVEV